MPPTPTCWLPARANPSTRAALGAFPWLRSLAASGSATGRSRGSGACRRRRASGADRAAPAELDAGGPNVVGEGSLRIGRRRPAGREGDQPVEPDVPVAADEIDARLPGIPHRLVAG